MDTTPDFIAVGNVTTDAFIKLSQAEVRECINHHRQELSLSFGDKIPYDFVRIVHGVGNSANAAVAAARLGLQSALVSNIGDDENGRECLEAVKRNGVDARYVSQHKNSDTSYHYVLWYGAERTILVKHRQYEYKLPEAMQAPKWMYVSSIGENSTEFHAEIIEYLKKHKETKLAFQPGTYQIKLGAENLKGIYERSDIFFCNIEEALKILHTEERDAVQLLKGILALGPKIAVITDGKNGAYAHDGISAWFMPVYPQEPYESTGAGDAFSSTVTIALALGKPFEEALRWGPINSASVVKYIGAQEGLLTREKLEDLLAQAPADYAPKKL